MLKEYIKPTIVVTSIDAPVLLAASYETPSDSVSNYEVEDSEDFH